MSASRRAASMAPLCCLLAAAGASAQAQQQPTRVDIVHCYVSQPTLVESPGAYRLQAFVLRGTTHASEPGGAFDSAATRCVGTAASMGGGQPPATSGYCELATSAEDRAVAQWTIEAGRGSGTFIGGTGRFRGISGEMSFQSLAPIPPVEPGFPRGCNRTTGEFRLP